MKPALTPARQRVAAGGADRRRSGGQAGRISLYWIGDPNGCAGIAGRGSCSGCAARGSEKFPILGDRQLIGAGIGEVSDPQGSRIGKDRRGSRIAANVKKCPGRIRSHKLPRLLDRGQWIAVRLARHAGAGPRPVTLLKAKQKKTRTMTGLIKCSGCLIFLDVTRHV